MQDFYYTYSNDGSQPFTGGWTRITAPDRIAAHELFRKKHPNKLPGLLNCAAYYNEQNFARTSMITKGNYGKFEQEHLEWKQEEET